MAVHKLAESSGNVLGFLAAPSREDSLFAISRALLKVRSNHIISCEDLGKLIDCSKDTVENASNEKSLLSFDSVARLGYLFPEEFAPVEELWNRRATEEVTAADRIGRIERELAALRRDVGA